MLNCSHNICTSALLPVLCQNSKPADPWLRLFICVCVTSAADSYLNTPAFHKAQWPERSPVKSQSIRACLRSTKYRYVFKNLRNKGINNLYYYYSLTQYWLPSQSFTVCCSVGNIINNSLNTHVLSHQLNFTHLNGNFPEMKSAPQHLILSQLSAELSAAYFMLCPSCGRFREGKAAVLTVESRFHVAAVSWAVATVSTGHLRCIRLTCQRHNVWTFCYSWPRTLHLWF